MILFLWRLQTSAYLMYFDNEILILLDNDKHGDDYDL